MDIRYAPTGAERRTNLAPHKFGVTLLVKLLLVQAQQELSSKYAQMTESESLLKIDGSVDFIAFTRFVL